MPYCSHCGKECSSEISFNSTFGVRYLCSEKCSKESRSWRMTKEQREQLERIEKELEEHKLARMGDKK